MQQQNDEYWMAPSRSAGLQKVDLLLSVRESATVRNFFRGVLTHVPVEEPSDKPLDFAKRLLEMQTEIRQEVFGGGADELNGDLSGAPSPMMGTVPAGEPNKPKPKPAAPALPQVTRRGGINLGKPGAAPAAAKRELGSLAEAVANASGRASLGLVNGVPAETFLLTDQEREEALIKSGIAPTGLVHQHSENSRARRMSLVADAMAAPTAVTGDGGGGGWYKRASIQRTPGQAGPQVPPRLAAPEELEAMRAFARASLGGSASTSSLPTIDASARGGRRVGGGRKGSSQLAGSSSTPSCKASRERVSRDRDRSSRDGSRSSRDGARKPPPPPADAPLDAELG